MRCPDCGRFMELRERYTNEHLDSADEYYYCKNGAHA